MSIHAHVLQCLAMFFFVDIILCYRLLSMLANLSDVNASEL